ncbi:MAG: hypothetical protein ABIE03_03470 [Patescibacteria group bacterium]|nr:hypothetical protein [Patescibacteria group bacterium]
MPETVEQLTQSREQAKLAASKAVESAHKGVNNVPILRRVADEVMKHIGADELNPDSKTKALNPKVKSALQLCVNVLYPSAGAKAIGLDLQLYFPGGADAASTPLR